MMILGGTSILLIFVGFVLGIVALVKTMKQGKQGTIGLAIAGICLNGIIILFMLIAIPTFIKAAQQAKQMPPQRLEQEQKQPGAWPTGGASSFFEHPYER